MKFYRLPFNNFLIAVNAISTKLSQVKIFLKKFGLPEVPERDLLLYSKFLKKRKIIDRPEFFDFKQYFCEHKITRPFSKAISIQENPFLWRMITAAIFLKKSPHDIVSFCRIDDDTLRLFKFYFMDVDSMDLFDINHYLNLLSDWDQQLLQAAVDQDEPKVMWMLGQIPQITPRQIVQDIATHAYYNYFKWSNSDKIVNNKIAKEYGELALKAILQAGELMIEGEKLKLNYVFRDLIQQKNILPYDEFKNMTISDIEPDKKQKH